MRVRVLFFGILREVFSRQDEWLELPAASTVATVLSHVGAERPEHGALLATAAVGLNQQYAGAEAPLAEGDEVALLPPVSGGAPSVSLTRQPIDREQLRARAQQGEDGALVIFDGIVRNNTRGRQTLFLDYEAYEAMALTQMQSLADEACTRFGVREVQIVHRLGRLEIGDSSVLIVVASVHRGAAFEACRWLIDTLKKTVPIWKKEHFIDGAVWADGEPFPPEIGGGQS